MAIFKYFLHLCTRINLLTINLLNTRLGCGNWKLKKMNVEVFADYCVKTRHALSQLLRHALSQLLRHALSQPLRHALSQPLRHVLSQPLVMPCLNYLGHALFQQQT